MKNVFLIILLFFTFICIACESSFSSDTIIEIAKKNYSFIPVMIASSRNVREKYEQILKTEDISIEIRSRMLYHLKLADKINKIKYDLY